MYGDNYLNAAGVTFLLDYTKRWEDFIRILPAVTPNMKLKTIKKSFISIGGNYVGTKLTKI